VVALEVLIGGDRYVPAPATQNVTVPPGSAVTVEVMYVLVTARLQVSLGGLPAGSSITLSLSGPGGYQHSLTGTALLTGLTPGVYGLHAPSLTVSGDQYQTQPESRDVTLPTADTIPVQVSVDYVLATGRLAIEVSGVPSGAAAAIQVTGPGFDRLVTQTDTLIGLVPGTYSVAAANLASGGYTYAAQPATLSVGVTANPTPFKALVAYAVATGGLQVTASGVPPGTDANIGVAGPGGFAQTLSGSQLLTDLAPGSYTVTAGNVLAGGQLYVPTPAVQTLSISASLVPQLASVSYALAPVTLTVSVSGLPNGVPANVSIAGPGGYAMVLSGSQTMAGLPAGGYNITSGNVSSAGITYAPQPTQQSVTLSGGATQAVSVAYSAITGVLSITVSGLPGGTIANIKLSGPGGFSQSLSGSQTLNGLVPGSYTIGAGVVSSGGTAYTPVPLSQNLSVSAGATSSASVSYSASGGGSSLDLTVNGAYLTQATQRYDGTVPLVAGRDAILRVFAVANQANSAQPQVRVRLYQGATLVQTATVAAPAASVPTAPDESTLTKSWNLLVPGALVQPGLKLLADVDPANGVVEGDESNNQFPVSGSASSVDVRALPTFALRFVPVLQQVNGLQGNVSSGNQDVFLADLRKLLPVGASDIDVRAPYTTTAPALQSGNGNLAWNTILNELQALRITDASSRYYYGVVKVAYGSGVAGLGFVGGSAHAAMGWDYLPSATNVMAHEVGHNLGRQHAPCGGPSGTDPSYPYGGGQIGVWGMDVASLTLKSPTLADLMSYCGPNWVSDYNWTGMLAYRQGGPNNAPDLGAGAAGLLIWGRITSAGVVLEPAFTVPAARELPRAGANRLELLAADGSLLRSVAFEASEIADLPGGTGRGFAFVLPLDAPLQASLAGFRVVAGSRSVTRLVEAGAPADPGLVFSRVNSQQVEVRWDAARFPMVMVRDAVSGQVLSFARGGTARLWAPGRDFELQFSDGVRGTARPARLLR